MLVLFCWLFLLIVPNCFRFAFAFIPLNKTRGLFTKKWEKNIWAKMYPKLRALLKKNLQNSAKTIREVQCADWLLKVPPKYVQSIFNRGNAISSSKRKFRSKIWQNTRVKRVVIGFLINEYIFSPWSAMQYAIEN